MTTDETKRRLVDLIDELTRAVTGADSKARPIACICRDLHEIGTSPAGRAAGYQRPHAALAEWRAFSTNGPSETEIERRRLVDAGWATPTDYDRTRYKMQIEAEKARLAFEAERALQRKREREQEAEQGKVLTRRSIEAAGKVW